MSEILKGAKNLRKEPIGDGESRFTDTHIFTDCCYIVKAVAQVHYIVIDVETGELVKNADIRFALQAANDVDEMHFEEFTDE